MKKQNKIIALVIAAITMLSVFGITLTTYVKDGGKLKSDVSGGLNRTGTTVYKDWSQLSSIDNDYSYSTLFYTKDTKFYTNASNGVEVTYTTNGPENMVTPYINMLNTNDTVQVIITNCGVDEDGNVLSAVLDVTAVEVWDHYVNDNNYTRGYVHFAVGSGYYVPKGTQANPNIEREQTGPNSQYNLPIRFSLDTEVATAKVRLTYYKNLTLKNINETKYTTRHSENAQSGLALAYAQVDTGNSEVATNITKVNSFYSDIDIPRSFNKPTGDQQYTDKIFQGREGIAPLNGSTELYYTKNGYSSVSGVTPVPGAATFNSAANNTYNCPENSTSDCNKDYHAPVSGYTSVQLKEADGGIFCRYSDLWKYWYTDPSVDSGHSNVNGLWYGQSAAFLTDNLQGVYEFTYSGSNNGSIFLFFTPSGYDTENPIKKVNKTQVVPGEVFEYTIQQYIPNNYFTNIVDLNSIYSNLPANTYITSFSFEDEFDERLTVLTDGITITDINGNDLTEYFTVSMNGNKLITTETAEAAAFYQTIGAYNNYYILKVPVKYVGEVATEIIIPNEGKTTLKIGDNTPKTTTTNRVTTKIVPKVIRLTYDCETNGGVATFTPTTKNEIAGADVDLTPICKKEGYKFVGWAERPTDKTNMTKFTMPDHDTTIYGLYTPVTCDLLLTSNTYTIDQVNHTVNIPIDDTDATILKNLSSKGTISINGDIITVKCEDKEQPYKINRFWINKTGNDVVKWTLIISGILSVIIVGILVMAITKKNDKKANN